MKQLIKPNKLNIGDTIATISLSGGAAGENNLLPWYNIAKGRLQEIFGLQVIETELALKG